MIQLNYTKNAVLAILIQRDGGNLAPSSDAIQRLDQALFNANDRFLIAEMQSQGVAISVEAKSQILLYSQSTTGETAEAQIYAACTFFKNTNSL